MFWDRVVVFVLAAAAHTRGGLIGGRTRLSLFFSRISFLSYALNFEGGAQLLIIEKKKKNIAKQRHSVSSRLVEDTLFSSAQPAGNVPVQSVVERL